MAALFSGRTSGRREAFHTEGETSTGESETEGFTRRHGVHRAKAGGIGNAHEANVFTRSSRKRRWRAAGLHGGGNGKGGKPENGGFHTEARSSRRRERRRRS